MLTMNASQPADRSQVDPAPYLTAVEASVRALGVAIRPPSIKRVPLRQARFRVTPDLESGGWPDARKLVLCWDEERGWWLHAELANGRTKSTARGQAVLLAPDLVAEWAFTVITEPELEPSSRDGRLRDSHHDPAFESALANAANRDDDSSRSGIPRVAS